MSETIEYNAKKQSLYFVLTDSTTGARKTGVAAASVTASYTRDKAADVQQVVAALATPQAAWAPGGWAEIDATNCPGLYRFDCPDAAFAYGVDPDDSTPVSKVEVTIAATGCHAETKEIELSAPLVTQAGVGASVNSQPTYTEKTFVDGTVRKDYL